MSRIPFIDLKEQYAQIKDIVDKNILNVLRHGSYIMGPEIQTLEQKLAEFVGVKHALTCSSGTDALMMALMAWNVGRGDAVFTTPFTFIATAEVISLLGATPIFVDIDKRTFNIDPDKLDQKIEETKNTGKYNIKAIIAVDLFGLCSNYTKINNIAKKYDMFLLEDAAQSLGASLDGQIAGSFGDIAATSFYPAKPLGGYGDSGAVFTNSDAFYDIMKSIRVHGQGKNKYDNIRLGINGRMDSIQAAVLLAKLKIFPSEIKARQNVATMYNDRLNKSVTIPFIPEKMTSTWAQYSILSEQRDQIQKQLSKEDIPTCIFYGKPLHLQQAFSFLGYCKGDFPIAEEVAQKIISLPMHPYLQKNQITEISESVTKASC